MQPHKHTHKHTHTHIHFVANYSHLNIVIALDDFKMHNQFSHKVNNFVFDCCKNIKMPVIQNNFGLFANFFSKRLKCNKNKTS